MDNILKSLIGFILMLLGVISVAVYEHWAMVISGIIFLITGLAVFISGQEEEDNS